MLKRLKRGGGWGGGGGGVGGVVGTMRQNLLKRWHVPPGPATYIIDPTVYVTRVITIECVRPWVGFHITS